jgi:glycosyltransferase involved in cell wall biosynthesis
MKKHEGRGTRLLFVGRLAEQKGLPILLDALAKVEGATLDIAGDGPERKMLEQKVNDLNISERVKILGYQSQPQVRALLKQADVFVMSSFAEGLPVVLMEAMAAGVPVVATWVAGIPEIVRDERNGLLIPPGDANALAQAIRRLLNDPDLRNQFASAGREKIEQDFNIETEVLWLEKILTSALNRKNEGLRPTS